MKTTHGFFAALALVAVGVLTSCESDSPTESGGSSTDPAVLQGTWVEIDSDAEVSSTGDTSYINRDTVYAIYSSDGSYTEIQRLWSKDVHSPTSDHQFHLSANKFTGTWSVAGNQLTRKVKYDVAVETSVDAFSITGSELKLVGTDAGETYSVVFHRYTGTVPGL